MNLANMATCLRMLMVPVFSLTFFLEKDAPFIISAIVFILAALTDIFDGWYARKKGLVSDFGKLMDPMADKLLTCTAIILLQSSGKVHPALSIILIGRELIISAFRLFSAEKGVIIAAGILGKIKTVILMVAIVLLLLDNPVFSLIFVPMDKILIWISGALSIWSCIDYFIRYSSLNAGK